MINLAHPKQRFEQRLLLTESNLAVKPTQSAPFTVTVRQMIMQEAECTRLAGQHRLSTVYTYRSGKHTAMTKVLSDSPWRPVDQAFVWLAVRPYNLLDRHHAALRTCRHSFTFQTGLPGCQLICGSAFCRKSSATSKHQERRSYWTYSMIKE